LLVQVGGEDFDAPSGKHRAHFLQAHRERIGLLAGRAGRAPDPQALARGAQLQHLRHDRVAEMFERNLVAEEEGLVGGHGFDHLGDEGARATLHLLHEIADAGKTCLARERHQAAFDQILLVRRQIETGLVPEQFTQVLIIGRGHSGLSNARLKHKAEGSDGVQAAASTNPTSLNLSVTMSLSNGFMMYSSAPASSARAMWSMPFSVVQNTTLGASPPGM